MNQILTDIGVEQWVMRKSLPGAKQVLSCHRFEILRDQQPVGYWQVSGFLSTEAEKLMSAMARAVHATLRRTTALDKSSAPFVIVCQSDGQAIPVSPHQGMTIELPHPEQLLHHPSKKASVWKKLLAVGVSS